MSLIVLTRCMDQTGTSLGQLHNFFVVVVRYSSVHFALCTDFSLFSASRPTFLNNMFICYQFVPSVTHPLGSLSLFSRTAFSVSHTVQCFSNLLYSSYHSIFNSSLILSMPFSSSHPTSISVSFHFSNFENVPAGACITVLPHSR